MDTEFELYRISELLTFLQKPTTEDLVQLSGTSKEASMTSFFMTLEDIEQFLQEISEILEAKPQLQQSQSSVYL